MPSLTFISSLILVLQTGELVVLIENGHECPTAGVVGEGRAERVEVQQVLELAEVPVEEHRGHVLEVDAEGEPGVVEVVEDGPLRVPLRQQPAE